MTEGALKTESLIEVDPEGRMYATIRLGLMDNIENPQFKVQKDGHSNFYDVPADLMKENYDANESDFRFEIPNENAIVRCTFYVVAMGRDVVFYIDFDNIREGSGDFVTSVEVRHNNNDNNYNDDNNGGNDDNKGGNDQPVQTTVTARTTTKKTATTTTTKKTDENSLELESSSLAETVTATTATVSDESVKGLELYDETGSRIENESLNSDSSSKSDNDRKECKSFVVMIVIAGVVVVCAGGACFVIWKKRRP